MRQEHVAVGQVRVGMEGDRRHRELTGHRASVQRLDVGELVAEGKPFGVDVALGERVEHERVVGVGTVRDGDGLGGAHARILLLPIVPPRAHRLDLRRAESHNEVKKKLQGKILYLTKGSF